MTTGFIPSFTTRETTPRKPMVVFGIPSFMGSPCEEFMISYIDTISALGNAGIPSATVFVPRDPYLSKARNNIATNFIRGWPMATHLFFLDDDIGWPGSKVVEFVKRDLDLITGVYPKKTDAGEYPCQVMLDDNGGLIEKDGLVKAVLAPTGFMCIKRHVLEKMAAQSGMYVDTTNPNPTDANLHFNIFDMGFFLPSGERPVNQGGKIGEFWGEDYYFVRRWRDMGGEVWVDPHIDFSHRGSKVWRGNFQSLIMAWREQQKVKDDERDRNATGGIAAGDPAAGAVARSGGLAEPPGRGLPGAEGTVRTQDGAAAGGTESAAADERA